MVAVVPVLVEWGWVLALPWHDCNIMLDLEVRSDAAGSLGYGAYFQGQWFYGSWAPTQAHQSIAYKELFPVGVAAHLLRAVIGPRSMCSFAPTRRLWSPSCQCPVLMHLLRDLLLAAARWGFLFSAAHCSRC